MSEAGTVNNFKLVLKKNKEFSILKGHPWVFSQAFQSIPSGLKTGDTAEVYSHRNVLLGMGYIDVDSPILVRLIQGDIKSGILFAIINSLRRAIVHRKRFFSFSHTNAFRLVNGEGDGLPGLIIDKYAQAISLQIYSLGLEPYVDLIVKEVLSSYPEVRWVYRRDSIRKAQGGGARLIFGKNMPSKVEFLENGLKYQVDLVNGQKTGFFLDQRSNRETVRGLAKGLKVLNICGYTGAFSVAAAAGGALSTVTVDVAKGALDDAKANMAMNGFHEKDHKFICADMYKYLDECKEESFDLVILDPPSMAKNRRDVEKALRAYKKLNALGARVVAKGGFLFTASCTGQVSRVEFVDVVRDSVCGPSREAVIIKEAYHDLDHPIALGHPEGAYLKGLFLRKV